MNGGKLLRVVVALLLAGAFAGFLAASASAADTGTITIHSRLCPAGQPTTDIYTDCHDNVVPVANSFSIDGGGAIAVDGSGNVSFTDVAAGDHLIAQEEGVPLDFAHLRVFCSIPAQGTEVTELAVDVNKFTVTAVAGEEVVCDVYTISENASGQTPTPPSGGSTGGSTGGTTLPNTGSGPSSSDGAFALIAALLAFAAAGTGVVALRTRTVR